METPTAVPRILILGGGFAGLEAARGLAGSRAAVTLVDRQNHHVFQPLLYQVAAATLSPEDIASPIRRLLNRAANVEVLLGEAVDLDPAARAVRLADGAVLPYDVLVLATGATHAYFGHDAWARWAPGLKDLQDALRVRDRFLETFERAEREPDPEARRALLTFVIVGGGPTGVELAGTLKEMARLSLPRDFRRIRTERARVVLVEAGPRILPAFGEDLAEAAQRSLARIGVEVRVDQAVTGVDAAGVDLGAERIPARTVLWAAGVAASPLGRCLGVPLDKAGRVPVGPDLSPPGHPEIFVLGDLAAVAQEGGRPLPGLAAVALQEGRYAARAIRADLAGRPRGAFRYRDRGTMATIGRGAAIAELGAFRFAGYGAWLLWLFVHLMLLVDFRNRVFVFWQWLWAYATAQRRARLILGRLSPRPGPPSPPG
ncbi:NAD(P)/FAD-dependent oxidoreductase [Mesoterricola sediminis]|uniref:NADH dehydrogenase n=1 Tax=Mesoterricola sediminis TaxID=2927980 RepID=A0AA48GTC6_9BACT|nr:NAD(P)/FAD-dependent oxidoreductase [Mesoterricola sediminis]BDU75824.1 NADH dehydrogenase [Mesoterricola sediminis]